MSRELEIFVDGACSGNPGEAAIGVVVLENKNKIKEISKSIGPATNNIAEYTALIYALQEGLILKADQVTVYTDSELVFNQVTGQYKIKNENLKLLLDQVQHLAQGFKRLDMKCIPREQNKDADQLATKAINKKQAKMVASLFQYSEEESPGSEG